jgi:predicted metal-binding transcription factor (methanogenesis marker protein 9)
MNKIETIELNTQEAIKIAEEKAMTLADNSRIKVNSQPTLDQAKISLTQVKEIKKIVQEKKDSVVKPLNEALKNTRALFKPIEDKVDIIETYLKSEVLRYNNKLLQEQRKREEEAQVKIEAGATFEEATKSVERIEKKIDAIPTRKIKRLKIIDASKIERQFLVPDEQAIKEALIAGIKVSGCELVEEEIIVNR